MGNCFAKFRKKKSVTEILSESSRYSRPGSSKLEDDMVKALSVSEFESSDGEAELGDISDTVEYTEVQEIHLEKPGFSYTIDYSTGKPDRMPSRLAERTKSRLGVVRSLMKINEEDERFMDEILREVEERERLQKEIEEKQNQAKAIRDAHLMLIREKARVMRMGAKSRAGGHGDGVGDGE